MGAVKAIWRLHQRYSRYGALLDRQPLAALEISPTGGRPIG